MGWSNLKDSLNMARIGFGFVSQNISEAYPDDLVVPIDELSNTFIFRNQFLRPVFRFDCLLSIDKMRNSLEQLITKHGWAKLGSRLRANQGKLEFCIPSQFSAKRPPMRFHLQNYESSSIREYDIPGQFQQNDCPAILSDLKVVESFFSHLDDFSSIEGFLGKDIPVFGLSIVKFKDGALVCISAPHILTDGLSLIYLLLSWALLLKGRVDELPETCDVAELPYQRVGTGRTARFWLHDQLSSPANFLAQFSLLQNLRAFLSGTETRLVSIPPSFIRRLRDSAKSAGIFVSKNDLLVAWWTQLVARQTMHCQTRRVALYQLVALPPILDDKLKDPAKVYIGNTVLCWPTMITAADIRSQPVCKLAALARTSLMKISDQSQIEALASLARDRSNSVMPTFGKDFTHTIIVSNSVTDGVFEFDLSGAIEEGEDASDLDACKPTFIHSFQPFYMPSFFSMVSKGGNHDTWLTGNLTKDVWEAIDKRFRDGDFGLDNEPQAKL